MKTRFHILILFSPVRGLLFTNNLKVKSEFWIKFIWSQTFKEHSEGLVKTINLCLLISKSSGHKFKTKLFS